MSSLICRLCMGYWCSTWSIKLWWYSKKDTTKSAWSELSAAILIATNRNIIIRLFVLGILMYGCGFLLWNLGDYSTLIKFKSFHAPQKTSSVTMWKLCEVPCLHCWLQLLSSMAGGICVQVGGHKSPAHPSADLLLTWPSFAHSSAHSPLEN